MHDLDPSGTAFRYGWDRNGKPIPLPETDIDLANIRDVMDGVESFFAGTDAWLAELRACVP